MSRFTRGSRGGRAEASLTNMISQMGLDPDVVQIFNFNEKRRSSFSLPSKEKYYLGHATVGLNHSDVL